ncbi:reverse transcriptase domain-containing protein, partial [Tanacetum coccineum]
MISREAHIAKSLAQENTDYRGKEIIFPPVAKVNNILVIIEAKIFGRKVGRVYMDSGSSCEIVYEHFFEKLNPTIKDTKVDPKTPLVGFLGERSWSIGEVSLEITIGDAPLSRTETLNFVIVTSNSSHNMLLGRTAMQRMGILVSSIHGAIKFHTKKGIGTVLSADETDEGTKRARKILATNEERVLSCVKAKKKIIVNDKYPDQKVTIGKQLPEHFKKELQNLLKSNVDIFAWTHADMIGILRTIMVKGKPFNTEHKLNKYSHIKPIWVANLVMGYHQIQIAEEDEDKTAFYAGDGVFCYKKMPFGLKNAGATYQRLVNMVFSHQIRRNLEAYVDNMVIKSTSEKEMLKDIHETFERFRSINMKLNPKKCSFGVEEGPFLGHLITKQGIKANPSKVKAVTNLDQSRTLKDIQSLNGKLAALSRFLSKGAKRSLAFFKVLKGCKDKKNIQWTTEADKALEKMKKLVQALPTLAAPRAIELGEHDIVFLRRNEKETPADFLVEIPFKDNEKKEKPKEVPDSN